MLHINLEKCCFIHFEPPAETKKRIRGTCVRSRVYVPKKLQPKLYLNDTVIKEVNSAKFLGIIIDNELSWVPHLEYLCKKLKSATGILNRLRADIPPENYKMLYHSLFESHMNYGCTVFGGIGNNKIDKIFRIQKHCMRVLFGDRERYIEKKNTIKAAKENNSLHLLNPKIFVKENSKPLFYKHKILAFKNSYNYHLCLEIFKILKSKLPLSIYRSIKISARNNELLLIAQNIPRLNFSYRGTVAWNIIAKALFKNKCLDELSILSVKTDIKELLYKAQNEHDPIEWYPSNIDLSKFKTIG